jgi:hypothetical protein
MYKIVSFMLYILNQLLNFFFVKFVKLSFNEQFQFMISNMSYGATECDEDLHPNTVLQVLGERIGNSNTFGENVIFMLNRAGTFKEFNFN